MKKTLTFLLALLLISVTLVLLTGCGDSSSSGGDKGEKSLMDQFKEKVDGAVHTEIAIKYSIKYSTVDITNASNSGNTYTANGKVTITDKNNDKYNAKFTAVYEYKNNQFVKKNLEITTPKK